MFAAQELHQEPNNDNRFLNDGEMRHVVLSSRGMSSKNSFFFETAYHACSYPSIQKSAGLQQDKFTIEQGVQVRVSGCRGVC